MPQIGAMARSFKWKQCLDGGGGGAIPRWPKPIGFEDFKQTRGQVSFYLCLGATPMRRRRDNQLIMPYTLAACVHAPACGLLKGKNRSPVLGRPYRQPHHPASGSYFFSPDLALSRSPSSSPSPLSPPPSAGAATPIPNATMTQPPNWLSNVANNTRQRRMEFARQACCDCARPASPRPRDLPPIQANAISSSAHSTAGPGHNNCQAFISTRQWLHCVQAGGLK